FVLNHSATGNVFRYNVTEGMRNDQWMRNLGGVNTYLYNNTIYLEPGQDVQLISNGYAVSAAQEPATNVWCYNNIFYSAGGTVTADLITNVPEATGIDIDNNAFYAVGSFTDTIPEDTNKKTADPVFANPGTGNPDGFQILGSSPYIGTGNIIAGNGGQDYWGNPVSDTEPPCHGAHEYDGGDTTPPAAPTGLAATAGDGSVSLDWADNTEPDLMHYDVYRSTTSGSGYVSIISGQTTSDYVDNGVTNGITYYYVVTATDTSSNESGNSNEDSATPVAPNGAPTFTVDPINEVDATEDAAYSSTLADDASDPESDPMTFSKVSGPAWLTVAAGGALSGTPANSDVGVNVFTVQVTATGGSDTATLNITVINTNDAPTFTADPIVEAGATEDAAYSSSIADDATDDDAGDTLTFSKVSGPAWLTVAANGALSGTPANGDVGLNSFVVKVEDAALASDTATLEITVANTNDAPTWNTSPVNEAAATEDAVYSSTLADDATDADSDPLTYAKVSGPAWLTVAANGALSGTPANGDVGANSWTVSVSDGIAVAVQATLNITVNNVNDAPTFTVDPINKPNATADAAYSDTIAGSATDPDTGDTLTYSKTGGPAWLAVAAGGGLSGTPAEGDIGANVFTVQVDDGNGGTDTAVLNITVVPAPSPPAAPSGLSATAIATTRIDLTWVDNADNETGFKIERSIRTNGSFVEIATVGADVTSYSDTTVRKGTTYYYRVRATNGDGDSAYSNEANATTPKK
ncbi:MAG: putative Ig domain-containing protein, partial [Planctomycetota bacterium]